MSDWLDELSRRDSEATQAPWLVSYLFSDLNIRQKKSTTRKSLGVAWTEMHADALLLVELRNNASEMISRARRADEAESRVEHLERENEQLRQRENEQRKQLNHIEAYCSDYVDDITTSHKMIRSICEVIGMEWEKRV